jgi:hypothetical protein
MIDLAVTAGRKAGKTHRHGWGRTLDQGETGVCLFSTRLTKDKQATCGLALPAGDALPFPLSQPALSKGKDAFRCSHCERTWDSFVMIRGTPSVAYSFFFVKGVGGKEKRMEYLWIFVRIFCTHFSPVPMRYSYLPLFPAVPMRLFVCKLKWQGVSRKLSTCLFFLLSREFPGNCNILVQ